MSDRLQCEFPNGVENKLGMSKVCIHSHTPLYIPHTAGFGRVYMMGREYFAWH